MGVAPRSAAFPPSQVGGGMALSLKMLPCKKRRAAAAGPHSPRERSGSGEDGEPPPPQQPPPPAAASSAVAAAVWRTPAEALPRGGRRPPQEGNEGRPGAAEPCAAPPERGEDAKRLEGGKEGKVVPQREDPAGLSAVRPPVRALREASAVRRRRERRETSASLPFAFVLLRAAPWRLAGRFGLESCFSL